MKSERKNDGVRSGGLFFQHPFGLEEDSRIINLRNALGYEGMGMFWEVYRRIRLSRGRYPADSIMLMAEGKKPKEKKLQRLLSDFDLFVVEHGMVSMGAGLTVKNFKEKGDRVSVKQAMVEELEGRTYHDTLMPEELKAMDVEAKENILKEIRTNNAEEVGKLLDFV